MDARIRSQGENSSGVCNAHPVWKVSSILCMYVAQYVVDLMQEKAEMLKDYFSIDVREVHTHIHTHTHTLSE